MATVLYIHENIKPEGISRSKHVADIFLEQERPLHPEDKLIELEYTKKISIFSVQLT
ncbi:MAG: hypothetical protein ACRCZG_05725 [Culicoidibacterales bacterium]